MTCCPSAWLIGVAGAEPMHQTSTEYSSCHTRPQGSGQRAPMQCPTCRPKHQPRPQIFQLGSYPVRSSQHSATHSGALLRPGRPCSRSRSRVTSSHRHADALQLLMYAASGQWFSYRRWYWAKQRFCPRVFCQPQPESSKRRRIHIPGIIHARPFLQRCTLLCDSLGRHIRRRGSKMPP